MESYEELLKKGMSKIKRAEEKERLEVPKPEVMKSGQRTVIHNLVEIANMLRREPQHLLKFLANIFGTFGELKGNKAEFIGNFPADLVSKRIEQYIAAFVRCQECKKLDTKIVKEDKYHFLKCEACGARHPIEKV